MTPRRVFLFGFLLGLATLPVADRVARVANPVVHPCDRLIGQAVDGFLRLEPLEARRVSVRVDIDEHTGVAQVMQDGVLDHEVRGHTITATFDRSQTPYVIRSCTERQW